MQQIESHPSPMNGGGEAPRPGEAPSAGEAIELPPELQLAAIAPALRERTRALSSQLRDLYDAETVGLRLVRRPPDGALRPRLARCGALLTRLDLRAAELAVDAALVEWLLASRPTLEELDISGCTGVSPKVLVALRASRCAWKADGCFNAPHRLLTAQQVVQHQVLALRQNTDAGIGITFGFASPANRRHTGPVDKFTEMIRKTTYQCMLTSQESCMTAIMLDAEQRRAQCLVTFCAPRDPMVDCEGHLVFDWRMSRQSAELDPRYENPGCWMTDSVSHVGRIPPQHSRSIEQVRKFLLDRAPAQEALDEEDCSLEAAVGALVL